MSGLPHIEFLGRRITAVALDSSTSRPSLRVETDGGGSIEVGLRPNGRGSLRETDQMRWYGEVKRPAGGTEILKIAKAVHAWGVRWIAPDGRTGRAYRLHGKPRAFASRKEAVEARQALIDLHAMSGVRYRVVRIIQWVRLTESEAAADGRREVAAEIVAWIRAAASETSPSVGRVRPHNASVVDGALALADEIERRWGGEVLFARRSPTRANGEGT